MAAAAPTSGQAADDTVFIVKDDDTTPSNSDIALALSAETPYAGGSVIVSCDDQFADALASGVLQSDAPLLLVPTGGPIPQGSSTGSASWGWARPSSSAGPRR